MFTFISSPSRESVQCMQNFYNLSCSRRSMWQKMSEKGEVLAFINDQTGYLRRSYMVSFGKYISTTEYSDIVCWKVHRDNTRTGSEHTNKEGYWLSR